MAYLLDVYDPLSASYLFSCPSQGEQQVSISSFRTITRLPGAAHPAIYSVTFACGCGAEHVGLASHDDLDWAPISGGFGPFLNLMTSRFEQADEDALFSAATKIKAGSWPWSFYCYAENQIRPAFPSSFLALAPGEGQYGLAVRCLSCQTTSINLVSQPHLDIPFYNDRKVEVVEHVFTSDADQLAERFSHDLWCGSFDSFWQSLDLS